MSATIKTGISKTISYNTKVLTYNDKVLAFYFQGDNFFRISNYSYTEEDMGKSRITCDLYFPADSAPQFTFSWYVEFMGERFYLKNLSPPAIKNTDSMEYKYSLIFVSERTDLERFPFANLVAEFQPRTDYDFSFIGDIEQFVERFNLNLQANFGSRWVMVLSDGVTSESQTVSCSRIKMWDLLRNVYEIYGLRWRISYDPILEKMVILIINEETDVIEIDHEFEYGNNNGLIEIERVNPTEQIVTRLSGRGGDRNVPPSYFHPETQGYPADPDQNEHTAITYYTNIMPQAYREYVRGWNGTVMAEPSAAYLKGVEDKSLGIWNPVDYVDSENISIYGIWKDALQDNEAIFPTIQGIEDVILGRLDEVIAVEQVLNDNYDELDESITGNYSDIDNLDTSQYLSPSESISQSDVTNPFNIITANNKISFSFVQTYNAIGGVYYDAIIKVDLISASTHDVHSSIEYTEQIHDLNTLSVMDIGSFTNVPLGSYYLKMTVSVTNGAYEVNVNTELNTIKVENFGTEDSEQRYKQTFDIWVKNIWGSTYSEAETYEEYADRIWSPLRPLSIQGDMTVMFSSGMLASEDYEFVVNKITYDTSKEGSEWKLTLIKSDAELSASNKYLPNKSINAQAGDYFFFINIILPQLYTYKAEESTQSYIAAELAKLDTELPTFTCKPSRVFCETFAEVDKIRVGSRIRLKDTNIIGGASTGFYITSLTLDYKEDSMLPDWQLVISDKVISSLNAVSLLQGDVKRLSANVYSSEQTIASVVRQFDKYFLRKDGLSQSSESPTIFNKDVTFLKNILSRNFVQGAIAGTGFGIFRDASGASVMEVDKLHVRRTLSANELVINQVTFYGGRHLYSAAGMEAERVEDTGSAYRVYMDTKQGSRLNQFIVGDQAFCQRFAPTDNTIINYYWRLVTAVGTDYIELSKSDADTGSGEPNRGDNIAQVGHRTAKERQSVLIIDQLSGGSVIQYAGISSYSWDEKDYVGYGVNPETGEAFMYAYGDMFIGDRDREAEDSTWLSFEKQEGDDQRVLRLKGRMEFTSGSSGLHELAEWPELDARISSGAATVVLTTNKQVFQYDSDGNLNEAPSSWFIYTTLYNLSGTIYYEWIKDDVTIQNGVWSVLGLTPPLTYNLMPNIYEVKVRKDSPTGAVIASDMITIFGIKDGREGSDGKDAFTVVLSNESHTVPADYLGIVSSYDGSGTDIRVWLGITPLPYGSDSNTFSVSASASGITIGSASTISTYTRRYANHSLMTADSVQITYTISARDASGNEFVFTRIQTITKSKSGSDADTDEAKNEIAQSLGYNSYADMQERIIGGKTIIQGGMINTELLKAFSILTNNLSTSVTNPKIRLSKESNTLDMYDSAGVIRARISGNELTAAGASSTNFTCNNKTGSISRYVAGEESGTYNYGGNNVLATISPTQSNNSISIPALAIAVQMSVLNPFDQAVVNVFVYAGSTLVGSGSFNSMADGGSKTINIPAQVISLAVGTTYLTIEYQYSMYVEPSYPGFDVSLNASFASGQGSINYADNLTEIATNGMRSRWATNKYFEIAFNSSTNVMLLEMRNGNYGLRITDSGFQKTEDGVNWGPALI